MATNYELEIHRNALKHLSRDDVIAAWNAVVKHVKRESDDEPPRWLCIGWLPNGNSVELIAVENERGWLIIHAFSPVRPKFAREVRNTERRAR